MNGENIKIIIFERFLKMSKIRIYKVKEILIELDDCIINKKPFSLIRWGDGGIKAMDCILRNQNQERLLTILSKEGIPNGRIYSIFYLWGKYAREANFIDSPEVYFTNQFWPRFKRPEIIPIIRRWKQIYNDSEFITNNTRYCNPEVNFLMLLKRKGEKNLIDMIRGRKICCLTNYPEIVKILRKYCAVKIFPVVSFYQNHYEICYKKITKKIKKNADKCDLWLVGAGEIGRIYSGLIKQFGGRALDIGSVFDCWLNVDIPKRLSGYVYKISKYSLEFRLLKEARKYQKFI